MKRHFYINLLALLVVLALPALGLAEELGDVTLYELALQAGEIAPETEPPTPAEAVANEVVPEAGEAVEPEIPEASPDLEAIDIAPEAETIQPAAGDAPEAADIARTEDAPLPEDAPLAQTNEAPDGLALQQAEEVPAAVQGAPAETVVTPDVTLGVGERWKPSAAADAYQSDQPQVASVDAGTGEVVANAVGTAILTAEDGSTRLVVAVRNAPEALAFGAAALSMGKGETRPLALTLPEGTAASQIKYSSSKKSVVAVKDGILYAKKTGKAVITATAYNGATAKCKVTVVNAPSKVTLSATKLVLCENETGALKARLPSKSASQIVWASSDAGVVAVDAAGNLRGVKAGTATVKATAFNGKKATCKVTVLAGSAPTTLSVWEGTLTLGLKEKRQLAPKLGEGENAVFAYASSKSSVATVSSKGVVTAKKTGSCKIAVTTHNGIKAVVPVKVVKAPGRVTLSRASLSMRVGETASLSAWVPAGTASAYLWKSSDTGVATVDGTGKITALKAGTAKIGVATYNKKTSVCVVTVTEDGPSAAEETTEDTSVDDGTTHDAVESVSLNKMVANLRACSALGSKREAIANVAELLMKNGFEPAFAAGVGANIYSEGTYGMFESSRYVTNPKARPRYFCYLDGGEYYSKSGGSYVLTAVYMSEAEMKTYTGKAEARKRFGPENYYLDNYSKKYVQDINLTELEAFVKKLAEGGWEGKFGVGIVQWTGSRTRTLVSMYRKHAGSGDSITAAQVAAAENEMILYDLKGDYKSVYTAWKSANKANLASATAAKNAGSIFCTRYEIPVDKESKAVTRGNKAAEIYRIMVGE